MYLYLHLHQQLSTYCSHKPAVHVRTLIDPPTSDRSAMNATDGSAAHFTPTMENSNFSFPFFFVFFLFFFQPFAIIPSEAVPLFVSFSLRFFPCFDPSFLCLSRKMMLLSLRLLRLSLLPPFSSLVFQRHTGYWESVLRRNPFGHGTLFLSAILWKYEFYPLLFFPVSRLHGRCFCLVCALNRCFGLTRST